MTLGVTSNQVLKNCWFHLKATCHRPQWKSDDSQATRLHIPWGQILYTRRGRKFCEHYKLQSTHIYIIMTISYRPPQKCRHNKDVNFSNIIFLGNKLNVIKTTFWMQTCLALTIALYSSLATHILWIDVAMLFEIPLLMTTHFTSCKVICFLISPIIYCSMWSMNWCYYSSSESAWRKHYTQNLILQLKPRARGWKS